MPLPSPAQRSMQEESFNSIGGQTRNNIAALDATTGRRQAGIPMPNSCPAISAIAVSGSTVYAGGSSPASEDKRETILQRLMRQRGARQAGIRMRSSYVLALAVSGSTVYAGGHFTIIAGQTRNYIAALDASGNATSWDPNASGGTVFALAVSGSTVYARGKFTSIGGQTRKLYCSA